MEELKPLESTKGKTMDEKKPKEVNAITFTKDGTQYTLEYDLASVRYLDSQGFNIEEAQKYPGTNLPILFRGAFRKHHRYLPQKVTDEILEELGNKNELWGVLLELYAKPIADIASDDGDSSEKKLEWTTV